MLGRTRYCSTSRVMLLDHHEFRQVRKLASVPPDSVPSVAGWAQWGSPPSWRWPMPSGPLRCFLDMDDAFARVRQDAQDEE